MISFSKNLLPKSRRYYLALSGGVDSMAALHFLLSGGRQIQPIYINHNTEYGNNVQEFLEKYIKDRFGLELMIYTIDSNKPNNQSQEEFWHHCRYEVFNSLDHKVITCHHLNDVVETFVYSSLHGEPRLIRFVNQNTIRPFLFTEKTDFIDWSTNNELKWIDDPTNLDPNLCMRNFIRNKLMPGVLKINPGIHKTVKKKLENMYKELHYE